MAGRGNTANLRPFQRGEARARDAGRTGGLRSAVARAENRALAEWAARIGAVSARRRGGASNAEAVVRKLYKSAIHGSLAAAKLLAEMLGELPRGRRNIVLSGVDVPRLIIDKPDGELHKMPARRGD